MYIAVSAEGQLLTDEVSQCFDSCKYLLIVDMSDLSINAIKNEKNFTEECLAKKVIEFDCEAIITGNINPTAFDILAEACITRYYGCGNSAEKALVLMERNELKLIRNLEGTNGCGGKHHKH